MGTPAPVPRLRGRETEQRVLGQALDRVASGSLAILLIEGEAGIGKTRLLKEGLADAAARGMQVAAGEAEELERSRPFGLLTGAFGCVPTSGDPRRAAIGALLSAKGSSSESPVTVTSDPGLHFRVVDAFGDLVEALALSGPVVIGADDLQWADPSSLVTLAAMGRRLADLPVGIIGCFRPVPRAAELDGAVRALETAGARHLALSPLGTEAVSDLVSETVAAEPGPGLLAEIAGAAGNPLFVTELLAALLAEGAIQVTGRRAEVAEPALPPTLRLTILRRLSFLPEDTLQVLRVASILGSAFSLTDLTLISGRPGIGLTAVLTEAIRARVIDDDGVQLRFRHDLIRDSIYEDLPVSVRRALHREAAQRLAKSGAPSLRVAEHFARGATEGDGEAIQWLTGAARETAPGSPAAAAALLDRAVTLMRPADPGRDRLMAERAAHLMQAGHIADAEAACRRLLDRPYDPAIEAAARICLGQALLSQGRPRDGLAEMDRAAESPLVTGAELATARAWASFARLSLGDMDGAASAGAQASSAASAAGDPYSASIAANYLAMVALYRGQFADALRLSDDALRLAGESLARQGRQYPVHIARGQILINLGRIEEGRSILQAGRRTSEERGFRWALASFGVFLGIERFIAGEWDDALAELESSLALAEEIGESYPVILAHIVIALISFHRDDHGRAAAAVDAAYRHLSRQGFRYRELAAWPPALLQEVSGESAGALETMTAAWEENARLGISAEHPVVGADLVRLAMAEGDTRRARQAAATRVSASFSASPWHRSAAPRSQGTSLRAATSPTASAACRARRVSPWAMASRTRSAPTTGCSALIPRRAFSSHAAVMVSNAPAGSPEASCRRAGGHAANSR